MVLASTPANEGESQAARISGCSPWGYQNWPFELAGDFPLSFRGFPVVLAGDFPLSFSEMAPTLVGNAALYLSGMPPRTFRSFSFNLTRKLKKIAFSEAQKA